MSETTEQPYAAVLAVDWQAATVAFSLPAFGHVSLAALRPEKRVLGRTGEACAVGRLDITGLRPATKYETELQWDGGGFPLRFSTLPAPQGERRRAFAAVADTHVSRRTENRKGRLFAESAAILRDLVDEFNSLDLDGVLVAGDLTNDGLAAEYALLRRLLADLRCPLFAVPGDHDLQGDGRDCWNATFGPTAWRRQGTLDTVVGLDTSGLMLGAEGGRLLEQGVADAAPLVVVTHAQLYPDDYIRYGKTKGVRDREQHADLLARLARRGALIYVGHQNVPARAAVGRALQVNLPQPVQYLCGYLLVREYANGVYHTFRPIRSAALDEYSRLACNQAAVFHDEPQWHEAYRRGRDYSAANFLAPCP